MTLGPLWGILAARGGAFPTVARRPPRGGARAPHAARTVGRRRPIKLRAAITWPTGTRRRGTSRRRRRARAPPEKVPSFMGMRVRRRGGGRGLPAAGREARALAAEVRRPCVEGGAADGFFSRVVFGGAGAA